MSGIRKLQLAGSARDILTHPSRTGALFGATREVRDHRLTAYTAGVLTVSSSRALYPGR
jgi:hypothetical protein